MKSLISLFLSQSYKDAWDDYMRSLNRENFCCWDYVILTASNEQQANIFTKQIKERCDAGLLPLKTHYAVIPDPAGERVGSGGATLNVIKYLAENEGGEDFSKKRILVIHSGGDSKRVPQYSALGKLFSPVPRQLPDGRSSTLFDEFIIGMSGMPARIREGMLLLSGDVLLLFNPLQVDFSGKGAAAISFKEKVEIGKNHGIFLLGEKGNVAEFLHKQPVDALREKGAVNEHDCVDIDTGAIIFSAEILKALYSLISENGEISVDKVKKYVNSNVRLSLYGDFLYPLASDSTLEQYYKEKPEGEYSDELTQVRNDVWDTLHNFRMKLLRLSPAKFLHFGTTHEIMRLMHEGVNDYEHLNWTSRVNSSFGEKTDAAAYNSILSAQAKCGENCYLEVSYVHSGASIGNNVLLSYVDVHDETIPDDVVLHGLKLKNGKFVVRIYGINDNPKDEMESGCNFLTTNLKDFMLNNNIKEDELWNTENHSLWLAHLYPECSNIKEAIAAALNVYDMCNGEGDVDAWRKSVRRNICEGFNEADCDALLDWNKRMKELVKMDQLSKLIRYKKPAELGMDLIGSDHLTKIQEIWLEKKLEKASLEDKIKLNYYVGKALGGVHGEKYMENCFKVLRDAILKSSEETMHKDFSGKICCDEHEVRLPLRVNWGGGWSDTPPYCNENGGTVLNAAISLNGELPVRVILKRLNESKIIFESSDMESYGEFDSIEPLQDHGNPYDQFALQKAVFSVCGVIPEDAKSLKEVTDKLGGGIYMSTEVVGVPKGSGLGTSSILAGACVKAVLEFLNIDYINSDIYDLVLCAEQKMSTGGGWQDQVGGLTSGIKFITSKPGLKQKIEVSHVKLSNEIIDELNERMALIYTGQRRLARNLLRDVVGKYIGNDEDTLYVLSEIQRVAALMRFELERGNVDEFAHLLSNHWELSKKLDAGSTNTCIDQIFNAIDEFIEGKMICGAGGGGFLQVILKKGVTKEALSERLHNVFQDSGVDVWDCKLI